MATTSPSQPFWAKCQTLNQSEPLDPQPSEATTSVGSTVLSSVVDNSTRQRRQQRNKILLEVEPVLLQSHVTLARTRTNIHGVADDGRQYEPRSELYGACVRRGHGITTSCTARPEVLAALLRLASSRPLSRVNYPFACIQVTVSKPEEGLPAHKDKLNLGKSDIIGLGSYQGGELWVASSNGHQRLPTEPASVA